MGPFLVWRLLTYHTAKFGCLNPNKNFTETRPTGRMLNDGQNTTGDSLLHPCSKLNDRGALPLDNLDYFHAPVAASAIAVAIDKSRGCHMFC